MKDKLLDIINNLPFIKRRTLDFNRKRGKREYSGVTGILKIFGEICVAAALGVLIAFTFFSGVTNAGISMEPVLSPGSRVWINRASNISGFSANDIVAFKPKVGLNNQVNIKRIVAVPGDRVYISNGKLYVNNEKESPLYPEENNQITDPGLAKNEIILGEHEYFLLGDNRNNSEDSRYESIGLVKKSDILGKVWFCYSLSNFGLIG